MAKPGRPRKFKAGDVVWYAEDGVGIDEEKVHYRQYAVVVAYWRKGKATHPGYYKLVRLTNPSWQAQAWGGMVWKKSNEIHAVGVKYGRPTVVRRTRVNRRIPDRGCYCNCCIHVRIPPSSVRDDGSFIWDSPKEDDDGRA